MRTKRTADGRRSRGRARIELNRVDQRIITHLRQNGRMTNRELARHIGVTEWTVATRIQRMQESGVMRVVAVRDLRSSEYNYLVIVGVEVEGRPIADVARQIAKSNDILVVDVVAGQYDIRFFAVSQTQADLLELLKYQISAIEGVRHLDASMILDVIKWEPDWVSLLE